jgi:hypothetical protein
MAYEFNGTNQRLSGSAPLTATPLTMACWMRVANNNFSGALITLGVNAGADRFQMFVDATSGGGRAAAAVVASGVASESRKGFVTGSINSPPTSNVWYHICSTYESNSSRQIYINASTENSALTNPGTYNPGGINSCDIGARWATTLGNYFNGQIAEVGIWSAALTAAEIASLAKGMTCNKVRPQSLVFYAPLVRDLNDQKGGLVITNNNGATVSNHPRVYA